MGPPISGVESGGKQIWDWGIAKEIDFVLLNLTSCIYPRDGVP